MGEVTPKYDSMSSLLTKNDQLLKQNYEKIVDTYKISKFRGGKVNEGCLKQLSRFNTKQQALRKYASWNMYQRLDNFDQLVKAMEDGGGGGGVNNMITKTMGTLQEKFEKELCRLLQDFASVHAEGLRPHADLLQRCQNPKAFPFKELMTLPRQIQSLQLKASRPAR